MRKLWLWTRTWLGSFTPWQCVLTRCIAVTSLPRQASPFQTGRGQTKRRQPQPELSKEVVGTRWNPGPGAAGFLGKKESLTGQFASEGSTVVSGLILSGQSCHENWDLAASDMPCLELEGVTCPEEKQDSPASDVPCLQHTASPD